VSLSPETIDSLRSPKGIERLSSFLIENGATIADPTNSYEVLRYKLNGSGTVVIYRRGNGTLNIPDAARDHLKCFELGRAIERKERPGKRHKDTLVERLLERDGSDCCICGKPLGDDITVEHWVAIKDGGNNTMANLGLAHESCNRAVDSKPVTEKVKMALEMRS
jgi:hypothetical protein